MATIVRSGGSASAREQSFWRNLMLGIALFIVFGFAQFAARGFVSPTTVPGYVHLHGVLMLSWLALSVVQASLVQRGSLQLHRRLGWLGVLLAVGVVAMGSYIGIRTVIAGRQPPFFSPPYFLALTQFGVVCFGALVAAAVAFRRQTEWHRRLMVGAMVLLMEPALGRVLPMPFIMPWGEWLAMVVQLGVLALVVRHDRRVLGRIHPATLIAGTVLVTAHVVVELLARTPAFIALTGRVIGA